MNRNSRGHCGRLALAALVAALPLLSPALARADDDDDAPKGPGAVAEEESIETENIFGFTLGTDTGEKGEKEVSFTLDGRFGRLGGSYAAYTGEAEFEYAVTDDFKVAVGAALNAFDISRVPGFDDVSGGGFGGAFFELKYRFLDRKTSPFGLSLSVEPEWARYDEASGERGTAYGIEFRLAADWELSKDFLFAAVNLVYAPEWERETEDFITSWSAGSGLELSGAVTAQVFKDIFIGGEVRYLAAYEGASFGDRQGWAVYLGPSIYAQVTENFFVKATWSFQVAGQADLPWNSNLDLVNFDRNQGRLQVGFSF
ncbi:hypothetical protein ABLE93_13000 [Xanthobacter sp. KR7-65]|uniref:hypothetical protein n=1 Tax=Xanthobacter sp. KR7-65 TaxID=3156612 RepID=UPI0032B61DDB